jgi:hypothetical protein
VFEVKGNMKAGLKVAALVMLAAVLSVALADEARAANAPKWVKTTYSWTLEKNPKQKDKSEAAYLVMKVTVKHTNNSGDKIITKLYDKTLGVAVTHSSLHDSYVGGLVESKKINEVKINPGKSHSITYTVPLKTYKGRKTTWFQVNNDLEYWGKRLNVEIQYSVGVKSKGI